MSYYLAGIFIGFLPIFFGTLQIIGIITVIPLGYHREPAFWAGAIILGTTGYYYPDLMKWLRKKHVFYTLLFSFSIILLVRLARIGGYPILRQILMWGPFSFVTAAVRAFHEEGFMGEGAKKSKKRVISRNVLRVAKRGNDQPWIGGWIYRLRKPIQRSFIRGIDDDMVLLSRIISTLSNGQRILFYCPFEPPNGEQDIFNKTIKHVSENHIAHEVYLEKHGRIKAFFTGEDESIGAISVDCSDPKILEWILTNYWLGDYCCWFVAHSGDFHKMAGMIHEILNPDTFPKGFKELILDSQCFMRDVETGEALEVITDKINREEIKQLITTLQLKNSDHQDG